jgi:hypothetical protein
MNDCYLIRLVLIGALTALTPACRDSAGSPTDLSIPPPRDSGTRTDFDLSDSSDLSVPHCRDKSDADGGVGGNGMSADGGDVAIVADKELVITHSSVVLDARASSANDGHWSFRWLMEQMTPDGVDPGDFVETWLQGLRVRTVNGFAMDDRDPTEFVQLWPRTAAGKLDLARAPFRLLAITNRIDIGFNGSPGEGRFVFGLVGADGFGRKMTVIFEYRLAPLGTANDRSEWAKRWHALAPLPFGDEYNAQLQAVTDGFAARGADPSRPAQSSLGQLRINEIFFALPWELREFNLLTDAQGTFLRPATTKQNPDQSLNGSARLAQFLLENADDVCAGTAVIPPDMLGGNAPEVSPSTQWKFPTQPAIDEPLRRAFAMGTCNGCHDAEAEPIDGFYHVSPLGLPIARGSDGTSRLSPFLLFTDLPKRIDNMVALLGEEPRKAARWRRLRSARVH